MRIAAYVTSTIASIREVVAGARTGDVAIEGVFSHPSKYLRLVRRSARDSFLVAAPASRAGCAGCVRARGPAAAPRGADRGRESYEGVIKLNTIVFMNTELNTGVIKVFELKYPGYKSFRLEYSYLLRPHYS